METILVVDDTVSNIDILVGLLGDRYEVSAAIEAQSALEIIDEQIPDLILLDIMMPGVDGFKLFKQIKNNPKNKDIPIMFLSSQCDEFKIEEAFSIGAVDYITKPFRPKELLARVNTQLKLKYFQSKQIEYYKNRAMSELIHNISHQWRQPLSFIATSASGLSMQKEMGVLSDDEFVNRCNEIVDTTNYLSNIIEKFNSFTDETDYISKFDLKYLVEENYDFIFSNTKDIEIIVDIEKNINIESYSRKLIQVLYSLVSNSKEALENIKLKKMIKMVGYKKDDHLVIKIYDNAKGVRKEKLEQIFDPYFTTKHQSQGKGLGLYNVKKIVNELLNGKINHKNYKFKYNDKENVGLWMKLELPYKI